MKKRNLVVANWKMNPETLDQAKKVFGGIRKVAEKLKNTDVVICAPSIFILPLSKIKRSKNVYLGAQNAHSEIKGAFTGEVSGEMLKDAGVRYVIVGHSERRAMGETNALVGKKLQAMFDAGLTPILCLGEKERDREGEHLEFLKTQIKECLSNLHKKDLVGITLAYEPVWAIGKSYKDAPTATDVHEMTLFIKKIIAELFGPDIAGSVKILYGGSVEAENAFEIMNIGNVEGFLVGHASLTEEFSQILLSAAK